MIEIGKYNELEVSKIADIGIFLSDGTESVLLPGRYVSGKNKTGDRLKVFVYLDNESRKVATTLKPFATVGEFAFLEVKEINNHGAFFNWGIDRDVFAPYSELKGDLQKGNRCLVFIFIDEVSERICASVKWNEFIDDDTGKLNAGDEVQILVARETDFGYKAIIDHRYEGLLYRNEIFQPLSVGDALKGFIRKKREDGKIDLSLQRQGYGRILGAKDVVLEKLRMHNGILPLGDKSSPEEIYRVLGMSKKTFKKTIGTLFKDRAVVIGDFEVKEIKS